ncbi:MAG TPA: hypothetical protein PLM93_11855 [Sulfuricurvum sp.]|nr:MAG: hypothetical protein B7Y30_11070 [Campylobacterales bacterium 16-40-21]OZA02045.1 MAG: hypothetical protein B7X89_11015 [Sulfuricurvum sp. 17-40-25]HQS67870.1 hypothetical protein [Sulfuricurvum sp.]HQT37270.1 hypothetical protein [Sulfuricurvum sp.]
MFILTLIGLVAAGLLLYGFIEWFNGYTQEKARYKFFTMEHSAAMVISYGLIFFGNGNMQSALENHGDALNGALVIGIGAVILIVVIVNNFKNAPKKLAFIGTVLQIILYIPIAIGAVIIAAAMFAYFSQTKPVYNINSRD